MVVVLELPDGSDGRTTRPPRDSDRPEHLHLDILEVTRVHSTRRRISCYTHSFTHSPISPNIDCTVSVVSVRRVKSEEAGIDVFLVPCFLLLSD